MQTRGSAPLFWEQKGKAVSALNGRPRLSRAMELTLPALRRHLAQQADVYGAPLLLSLLGQKGDDGEAELAASLGAGVQQLAEGGGGGGGGAAEPDAAGRDGAGKEKGKKKKGKDDEFDLDGQLGYD